jgi:hypothetical protein
MADYGGDQFAWHQTLPRGVHALARKYRKMKQLTVD